MIRIKREGWFPLIAVSLLVFLVLAVLPSITMAQDDECNRRCLLEMLTKYTEALADNDISKLPISEDLRVTNNGLVTDLGTGDAWGQVNRIPYRQAFVDPVTGSAMFLGTLTNTPTRNHEIWWFYALRLKVENRELTEVEEIFFDGTLGGTPASIQQRADRIFDTVLPESERVSREELFHIADLYFDAVSFRIDYNDVPWHPECTRVELAAFTVNSELNPASCGGEFQNPGMKWLVENRRFYIADEVRGVVFAIGNFMTPPDYPNNNGSVVFEVFKIQDGLIRHIEAHFRGNNTQKVSGWGTGPGSGTDSGSNSGND